MRHDRIRTHRALALGLGLAALLASGSATAAGGPAGFIKTEWTPVQLALSPGGVQVFHKETSVTGWRLSLLYGTQKKVHGLDTGLFSDAYTLKGVQIGLGNQALKKLQGVQIGVANGTDHGSGVQLGFLNKAHDLTGVQLGVLNFNDAGFLPVFPLINFPPFWR